MTPGQVHPHTHYQSFWIPLKFNWKVKSSPPTTTWIGLGSLVHRNLSSALHRATGTRAARDNNRHNESPCHPLAAAHSDSCPFSFLQSCPGRPLCYVGISAVSLPRQRDLEFLTCRICTCNALSICQPSRMTHTHLCLTPMLLPLMAFSLPSSVMFPAHFTLRVTSICVNLIRWTTTHQSTATQQKNCRVVEGWDRRSW